MLDRDEDMAMTGTRHPFLFKYRVACTNDGKIIGCRAKIYQNAGYSIDLSISVNFYKYTFKPFSNEFHSRRCSNVQCFTFTTSITFRTFMLRDGVARQTFPVTQHSEGLVALKECSLESTSLVRWRF